MFSFSSSRLLSSYLLMSSIYLCLTFCFICKVSAAPSAKSWGLTILTTLPCVLHLFRCPKLFSASYSSRVFTPSIAFFPSFPSNSSVAAALSLTCSSSLNRFSAPTFQFSPLSSLTFDASVILVELPLQPLVGLIPCYHFGLTAFSYSSNQIFCIP